MINPSISTKKNYLWHFESLDLMLLNRMNLLLTPMSSSNYSFFQTDRLSVVLNRPCNFSHGKPSRLILTSNSTRFHTEDPHIKFRKGLFTENTKKTCLFALNREYFWKFAQEPTEENLEFLSIIELLKILIPIVSLQYIKTLLISRDIQESDLDYYWESSENEEDL